MPAKKVPRWGPEQNLRCNEMFDLFVESGGNEGWDPRRAGDSDYIIDLAKGDTALEPFLVASLGGWHKNTTSSKVTKGYARVSSKYLEDASRRGQRIPMGPPGAAAAAARAIAAPAPAPAAVAGPPPPTPAPARSSLVASLFGSPSRAAAVTEEKEEKEEEPMEALEPPAAAAAAAEAKEDTDDDMDDESTGSHDNFDRANDHATNVDTLTERMEEKLKIASYVKRRFDQKLPYIAWAWADGETDTNYLTIRIALFGFIRAKDIKAYVMKEGWVVRFIFDMRAELSDPEPLMMMNGDYPGYNESTSQYSVLSQAHRQVLDATQDGSGVQDTFEMVIDLPFECEKEFVDPFSMDNETLSVGNFPLDPKLHPRVRNAPEPCQKYLHVTCEEKNKKKSAQKFKEHGYVRRRARR